jgi:hypothetical protein
MVRHSKNEHNPAENFCRKEPVKQWRATGEKQKGWVGPAARSWRISSDGFDDSSSLSI